MKNKESLDKIIILLIILILTILLSTIIICEKLDTAQHSPSLVRIVT
ncbi:hypothetical protein [Gemella cuniculi]|nr:hypothetical protein [Gemella cuniculi]